MRFLNKHGGKPLYVYDAVREMSERASAGLKPAHLAALAGTNKAWFCGGISCQLVHPGQTCSQHALEFFPGAYLRALPVYFPGALLRLLCAGAEVEQDAGQGAFPQCGL